MNKETEFAAILQEIKDMAREQGNLLSLEQVETKLLPLELTQQQMELVYEYLESHKIGVEQELDPDEYLTQEEKDYLYLYLEEIAQIPDVSEGEKQAILLSAMAGEDDAQKQAISLFLPKVVEVAKLYGGQGVLLEDLIGEGNIALTMGVKLLGCLEHAKEAEGMLGKMMMDAMESCIRETMENEECDQQILERVSKVTKGVQELEELLQRKVTIAEIVEETGFTHEEVNEVLRILGGSLEIAEDKEDANE